MEITHRIRLRAEEFGQEAPNLFDTAFDGAQELGLQFRADLQQYNGPTGTWAGFFADAPLRLLELPVRVLADLKMRDVAERERSERALVRAAAVNAALTLLNELVLWAESSYSYEHAMLAPGLHLAAGEALGELCCAREVRTLAQTCWAQHVAASLAFRRQRVGKSVPFGAAETMALGHRWAPATLPALAAALTAGRPDLVPELSLILETASGLFQLIRDLGGLHRDLSRGHCTYPIARLMEAFGIEFSGPPHPDRVLLAAVLTRTVAQLAAEGQERARELVKCAGGLGLPSLGAGLEPLARAFEGVSAMYCTDLPSAPEGETQSVHFVLSHRPQIATVRQAAKGYLDADPEFRECWEVYRWDFLNAPLLTSRVFPIGLVLEQQLEAGNDCSEPVSKLLESYAANHFHYYDESSPLPPDVDTLGLMLRLARRAADPDWAYRLLETPVQWALRNEQPDGSFPVFMTRGVEPGDGRPYLARVVGQHCAAVLAGFALGMLHLPRGAGVAVACRAAEVVLKALAREGTASLTFYDAPFAGVIIQDLLSALEAAGAAPAPELVQTANIRLHELLRSRGASGRLRPHDAALLLLATRAPELRRLYSSEWLELLVRTQHIDGSWEASPLYVLPQRGNLSSMHSSRLITTAFCYRALCAAGASV